VVLVASVASWGFLFVRPRLISQSINEREALASYKQSLLVRLVAEYAVKEYTEGIYTQDEATFQAQIDLARADMKRAMARLVSSRTMERGGDGFDFARQQTEFDLEQALTQLSVLENYTKEKQIKSLNRDVEQAKADEMTKLASLRLEQSRKWRWAILGF
jgi:hypothetical protein